MCCRYTLAEVEFLLNLYERLEIPAPKFLVKRRYNVAPRQPMPVALEDNDVVWAELTFGFATPVPGNRTGLLANARAETILEKPAFREAVQRRRCLVPADGFYEWQKAGRARLPHYFYLQDRRPFFFAGIWQPPGRSGPGGFALVTTAPNELMAPIHDRMPVILPADQARRWLGRRPLPADELHEICRPLPAGLMGSHRVSPAVNNARHEGPDCIAAVENDPELPLRFT